MFNRNFAVRGGGGWIALPNGLWHFFSEYEPLLRNQICIVFHHYLPWFPSEYYLRTMFDHSYCENIHSQSQNRRFKEFVHFRRKIPATKRPFAWGGEVETLSGRMPFEHAVSLCGASLSGHLIYWQLLSSEHQSFVVQATQGSWKWRRHHNHLQTKLFKLAQDDKELENKTIRDG